MFCLQKYNTKQWIRTQKEIQYTDVMKQDEGTKFSHIVFLVYFFSEDSHCRCSFVFQPKNK